LQPYPIVTSCFSTCPTGYYGDSTSVCTHFTASLSPATAAAINTTGAVSGAITQAQTVVSSVIPIATAGLSSSAVLLVGFLAEVDIYKFINVPFPENFVLFCQSTSVTIIPNIMAPLDDINKGKNPNSNIGKFQFWGHSATLLDNSNFTIVKDLFVLGVIILLNIIYFNLKYLKKSSALLEKIRNMFMWNTFLSFILGDYMELQLNSMIQLRENSNLSSYTRLSLVFSVVIVVSCVFVLSYLAVRVNQRLPAIAEQLSSEHKKVSKPKWAEMPKNLIIMTSDFQERNSFTRSFMIIMIFQQFLQILVVFSLQEYGLAQAILYTVINVIYTALIAWQRPYRSKVQMGVLIVNQTTKIVLGTLAIVLGSTEMNQTISADLISHIGTSLIILITAAIAINLVISLIVLIVGAVQYFRRKCAEKNSSDSGSKKNIEHIIFLENSDNSSSSFNQSHVIPEERLLNLKQGNRGYLEHQILRQQEPKKKKTKMPEAIDLTNKGEQMEKGKNMRDGRHFNNQEPKKTCVQPQESGMEMMTILDYDIGATQLPIHRKRRNVDSNIPDPIYLEPLSTAPGKEKRIKETVLSEHYDSNSRGNRIPKSDQRTRSKKIIIRTDNRRIPTRHKVSDRARDLNLKVDEILEPPHHNLDIIKKPRKLITFDDRGLIHYINAEGIE
jgi:hypothetical protein